MAAESEMWAVGSLLAAYRSAGVGSGGGSLSSTAWTLFLRLANLNKSCYLGLYNKAQQYLSLQNGFLYVLRFRFNRFLSSMTFTDKHRLHCQ